MKLITANLTSVLDLLKTFYFIQCSVVCHANFAILCLLSIKVPVVPKGGPLDPQGSMEHFQGVHEGFLKVYTVHIFFIDVFANSVSKKTPQFCSFGEQFWYFFHV